VFFSLSVLRASRFLLGMILVLVGFLIFGLAGEIRDLGWARG
jgi:hypothetical protein